MQGAGQILSGLIAFVPCSELMRSVSLQYGKPEAHLLVPSLAAGFVDSLLHLLQVPTIALAWLRLLLPVATGENALQGLQPICPLDINCMS